MDEAKRLSLTFKPGFEERLMAVMLRFMKREIGNQFPEVFAKEGLEGMATGVLLGMVLGKMAVYNEMDKEKTLARLQQVCDAMWDQIISGAQKHDA